MKRYGVLMFCCLLGLAGCGQKVHERFIFTDEKIDRARQNIEQHQWAAALYDSLKALSVEACSLDSAALCGWIPEYTPTRVVDCPHCHTSWKEYIWQWHAGQPNTITCRVCSTAVSTAHYPSNDSMIVIDPQGQSHRLPVHRAADGKVYQIQERIAFEKLFQRVRLWFIALGCVYAIEKDESAAAAAIRLLTRLGQVYPGYALHDWYHYGTKPWKLAGKISGWNYQDAIFVVAAGKAFDAVANSPTWTEEKRQTVVNGVFQTALDMLTAIEPAKQIINDTPFRYAGVAMCARLLRDPKAMRWVLNAETGVVNFIRRYWFPDGTWCERSPSYHQMALRNFHNVVEVLENYSDPAEYRAEDRVDHFYLQDVSRLQNIYELLFDITYPDGSMPPINDSHTGAKPPALFADAAYAWFESKRALLYLAGALKDSTFGQGTLFSLFYRPADVAETLNHHLKTSVTTRPSRNIEDMGLAILRSTTKNPETMVTVQYGGIYGGHDHFDKSDVTLFSQQREMLSDLGYVYSSFPDIFTWMQRSLAHNTVTVDGINHRYIGGECPLFYSKNEFHIADIRNPWIYHMVTNVYRRQLMLIEHDQHACLVDVFRVRGGEQHDWSAHAQSKDLRINRLHFSETERIPGCDYAYRYFSKVETALLNGRFEAEWRWMNRPRAGLRLHMLSPKQGQLFRALAPAQRRRGEEGKRLPWLLLRSQKQAQTTFVAVWEPFKAKPVLRSVELDYIKAKKPAWPVCLRITWQDGTVDRVACALQDKPKETLSVLTRPQSWKGRFGIVRVSENRIDKEIWLNAFY